MSGWVVGGKGDIAKRYPIAVAQDAVDLDWGLAHNLPIVPVMEIALSAILHHGYIAFHDSQLRPG